MVWIPGLCKLKIPWPRCFRKPAGKAAPRGHGKANSCTSRAAWPGCSDSGLGGGSCLPMAHTHIPDAPGFPQFFEVTISTPSHCWAHDQTEVVAETMSSNCYPAQRTRSRTSYSKLNHNLRKQIKNVSSCYESLSTSKPHPDKTSLQLSLATTLWLPSVTWMPKVHSLTHPRARLSPRWGPPRAIFFPRDSMYEST